MHARITTISGVTRIDEGVQYLRDEVVRPVQEQVGYRGLTANCDREAGIVSVLTLWETREDLDASESAVEKVRREAATAFGGKTEFVERYEQTVAEVGQDPPTASTRLQIRRIKMDPAKVDENVEFFKSSVVPEILATPGCQGLRQMIDRASGEGAVGILWADARAMEASNAGQEERRAMAASRGVEFGELMQREVLFSAL
jgi:hypothetical protein